jgi:hypothetical protein
MGRPVSLGLHPPPPSPSEPGIYRPSSDWPFVRGFAPPVSGPFGLCGRPLSLAPNFAALSLHPKIPFLAAEAQRLASGLLSHGSQTSAALATAVFFRAYAIVADSSQALRTADSIPP